jgi:hypothetical protein
MRIAVIDSKKRETLPILTMFKNGCQAYGWDAEMITPEKYFSRPSFEAVATYGILRGSAEVIKHAMATGKDYYWIDHAYIDRVATYHRLSADSMFRITKNNHQNVNMVERPCDRWDKMFSHNHTVEEWKESNREIMICPPSRYMVGYFGISNWTGKTLHELRKHDTTKRMFIREKTAARHPIRWDNLHAIVGFNTSLMVESLIRGIPVYAGPYSICRIASPDHLDIKRPWKNDRQPFLNHVAYSQFSLNEIRNGQAIRIIDRSEIPGRTGEDRPPFAEDEDGEFCKTGIAAETGRGQENNREACQ